MAGPETALPKPRLRLNRGQQALAAVLVLLLVAVLVSTIQASATQREHTRLRAGTESAGNDFSTVRETRNYVEHAERYLLGGATRRDVQVARALLGRRLQVVGTDGVTAGVVRHSARSAPLPRERIRRICVHRHAKSCPWAGTTVVRRSHPG